METELDFLVACLTRMREIRQTSLKEGARFQAMMEDYFRLSPEFASSFIYDEILRLSQTPAGSLKGRDPQTLKKIHNMTIGEYFRLDTRLCVLMSHNRLTTPKDGWLTYHFASEVYERSMDYLEAWTLCTEGRLTFGR